MQAIMILADFAQVTSDGKLQMIGGGWTHIGPAPTAQGLALMIEVDWEETNKKHPFEVTLLDADGTPALLVGPTGEPGPLAFSGELEVGRPPGAEPNQSLQSVTAVNIGPLPLLPGHRYSWRLSIDGYSAPNWRRTFYTRAAPLPVTQ